MNSATRHVWASTRRQILHGEQRLAKDDPSIAARAGSQATGVLTCHPLVGLDAALLAFDRVLADPGRFSISTAQDTLIDFMFRGRLPNTLARMLLRRQEPLPVTLDIWFEHPPQPELNDVLAVSPAVARELVCQVYALQEDNEIWNCLRQRP